MINLLYYFLIIIFNLFIIYYLLFIIYYLLFIIYKIEKNKFKYYIILFNNNIYDI